MDVSQLPFATPGKRKDLPDSDRALPMKMLVMTPMKTSKTTTEKLPTTKPNCVQKKHVCKGSVKHCKTQFGELMALASKELMPVNQPWSVFKKRALSTRELDHRWW